MKALFGQLLGKIPEQLLVIVTLLTDKKLL